MAHGSTMLLNYGKAQQIYLPEEVINDAFSFY